MKNSLKPGMSGLILLALAMCSSTARGDTITFQEGASPTAGYTTGATTIISGGGGANSNVNFNSSDLFAGNNSSASVRTYRSLFEFDLSAIRTAAAGNNAITINSVQLDLVRGTGTGSGNITVNLNASARDFIENQATYTDPAKGTADSPDAAGGTLGTTLSSATFAPGVTGALTFSNTTDFSNAALAAVTTGDGFLRFIANAPAAEANPTAPLYARFLRDEDATIANRPRLTVDYTVTPVPEPATSAMMGLGMLAIGGLSRAKKRRQGFFGTRQNTALPG